MRSLGCLLMVALVALGCGGKNSSHSDRPSQVIAEAGAAGAGGDTDAASPTEAGASDAGAVTLTSLSLTPANSTLVIGGSVSLKVASGYSDGSSVDVTSKAAFSSSSFAVASPIGNVVTALLPGSATITAQIADQSAEAHIVVVDDSVELIVVAVVQADCAVGEDLQFTASAKTKGGSQLDVTTQAAWQSSDPSVMIALGAGRGLCLSSGTSTISASIGAVQGSLGLRVNGPKLESYTLSPTTYKLVHDQEHFTLTATYGDGSTLDLTRFATFTSDTPAVLAFSGAIGSVLSAGSALVTAKLGDTVAATVKFGAATLMSIAIAPPELVLEYPVPGNLTATGTYADGSTADLSSAVTWDSDDEDDFDTDIGGLVTPRYFVESAPVSATLGNIVGYGKVSVGLGNPTEIDISDKFISGSNVDLRVPVQVMTLLSAMAQYAGNANADVSDRVTWHVADPSIASFDGPQHSELSAHKTGTTSYYATLDSLESASHSLTVTNAVLLGFTAGFNDSNPLVVPVGSSAEISSLTGIFDDASSVDLTLQAVWNAGNEKVSVTPFVSGGASWVSISGLTTGTSSIIASVLGHSVTMPVQVTPQ